MQFGLGTTKHGLQIKSLFPASYGTPNMIDFQAVHGSKVFLTVIAENHAGLSSTFTNNTINIDKTPPSMHSLQVSLTEDNRSGEVYDIFANWIAEDIESDIKLCFCRVGKCILFNMVCSLSYFVSTVIATPTLWLFFTLSKLT